MRRTSRALAAALTLLVAAGLMPGTSMFTRTARAAAFTVTSGADSGAGTLRAAVAAANSTDGPDTITFAIPQTDPSYDAATGRHTINLLTPLPFLFGGATITGPGANLLTIRRNPNVLGVRDFRIFSLGNFRNDTLDNYFIADLTISNGRVPYVAGSEVFLPHGGGILNSANLTLTRVVVSGNAVVYDSTGANGEVVGGGIYNGRGTLTLIDSTVSGNSVAGAPRAFGGGIANFGTLNLTNSTVSGNSAVWGDAGSLQAAQGGGVYNNGGAVRLTSSTVVDNSAGDPPNGTPGSQGGGIANILNSASPGTVNLRNSIVANNSVAPGGTGPDLSGAINSLDYNLIGNTAGATIGGFTANNVNNQNPLLGPLALNGGQTPTHAPQAGSPAVDRGDASGLTRDQRGAARPVDLDDSIYPDASDAADIGSFEHQFLPGQAPLSQSLIISEFRLRGPGANPEHDEYVEIYNAGEVAHVVAAADGSAGYALAASDGVTRFVIPNNTVIPPRGHYLGINTQGYSLANYGGTGAAAGDNTGANLWTLDIPDTAGLALFNNSTGGASFSEANRLDAVGPAALPAGSVYREGAGLAPLPAVSEYAVYRDLSGGRPRDSNDNAADFVVVNTTAPFSGLGLRLGAPGPENLSSPVQLNDRIKASFIDPLCSSVGQATASPGGGSPDGTPVAGTCQNTARDLAVISPIHSAQGTLFIRRRFTNNTGRGVTRLRFRIVDVTTAPAPCGGPGNDCSDGVGDTADLRALSSGNVTITTTGGQVVEVKGLALEAPPAQPYGGGWNSSLSAGTITTGTPLASGESIAVQFRLGVQQRGAYRFFVNVEALAPEGGASSGVTTGKESRGSRSKKVGRP